jgi:hypothetical protein
MIPCTSSGSVTGRVLTNVDPALLPHLCNQVALRATCTAALALMRLQNAQDPTRHRLAQ